MKFMETELAGAFIIELEQKTDPRGFFARAWCKDEFSAAGLVNDIVQCNIGFSERAGTLRGIHYQQAPHGEAKVVRCTRGSVFDVIIDVRPDSLTFGKWSGHELDADDRLMLFIPEGFGHGYQTLEDDTEIFYQSSEFYHPESAVGIRYNDPAFAIHWPLEVTSISEADRTWPDYQLEPGPRATPNRTQAK